MSAAAAAAAAPGRSSIADLRRLLCLDELVGSSPALARAFRQVEAFAPLEVTVLLTGPNGTGKTSLARALHRNSPRRGGPFLRVNCGGLPAGLIESELFGAVRGGHSTAHCDRRGQVAAAAGGTLFLDEIGELPAGAQAALLQLLDSGEYRPLGGETLLKAEVRFIAATNVDLEASVREGRFRPDLFHRLAGLSIALPSLAERLEDLPELSEHLVERLGARHGLPALPLAQPALQALRAHPWSGNVRELERLLLRGLALAAIRDAKQVEVDHLFEPAQPARTEAPAREQLLEEARAAWERQFIRRALVQVDWNVSAAARRLGIARSNLNKKLARHGLQRPLVARAG